MSTTLFVLPGIEDLPLSEQDLLRFSQRQNIFNFTNPKLISFFSPLKENSNYQTNTNIIQQSKEYLSFENKDCHTYCKHISQTEKKCEYLEKRQLHAKERYWTSVDDLILENEVNDQKSQTIFRGNSTVISYQERIESIDWEKIGEDLNRTGDECKNRYMTKIRPPIKRTPFELWEDKIIVEERKKIGNHWTLISTKIPGRTQSAVKNRWYSVLRHQRWAHKGSDAIFPHPDITT